MKKQFGGPGAELQEAQEAVLAIEAASSKAKKKWKHNQKRCPLSSQKRHIPFRK